MYRIDLNKIEHSPRAVKFWECCLASFYENLSVFKVRNKDSKKENVDINIEGLQGSEDSEFYLDKSFRYYYHANKSHRPDYILKDDIEHKNEFFKRTVSLCSINNGPPIKRQEFVIDDNSEKILNPRLAVANTKVLEENINAALRGTPNLAGSRFDTLYKIFKQTKEEKADILLFPECFIPIELLDRIVWFAVNEQKLTITGLEHVTIDNVSFNFIVTVLPFEKEGIKDAVVVFRLKNHYSHAEKLMINTNHFEVPSPAVYVYDLFIWKGIYFSPYYCFELANVTHRGIFKSQIDLLIACECNPDINYFSNIVESISRDLHVYVAQINTSQYGDTRITQPAKTEKKDILKLKGGENDTILVGKINLAVLREFQRELYMTTKEDETFKPLPPDFLLANVLKRIRNEPMF